MTLWLIWFWGKFQKYIILTGAAVAFVATVWFKGYSASQERFRKRQEKALESQRKSKEKIREKVRNSSDAELDRRMERWMRD